MSDRSASHNSIQSVSGIALSLRLSTGHSIEGYFYFTFYRGVQPMLDAGEV